MDMSKRRALLQSKMLSKFKLHNNIQIIPFELNLRKEKWLYFNIYKSPFQNSYYFVSILSNLLDFYSNEYENKVVLEVMKHNFCKLAAYERATFEKLHSTVDELLEIFRNFSEQLFLRKSLDYCFCQSAVY